MRPPLEQAIDLPATTAAERAADAIIDRLHAAGFLGYRVGGAVRDRLLGRVAKDVDVATDAAPAAVRQLFPASHAVGESFGVIVVHASPEAAIEVATFRADGEYADGRRPVEIRFSDPATDAARRDFTINGLFYDPLARRVIDHVGGLADLRAGVVRAIGEPARRFAEDHLRLLRAVRFAAALGFELEAATRAAMPGLAPRLPAISAERVYAELERMLVGPRPAVAFDWLERLGLMAVCLPEVAALKGVEQPPEFHPEGDVWTHTLLMLEQLRWRTPELAWSVLLHDLGKPPTQAFANGRWRFNGHAELGATMAEQLLRRLRAPNRLIDTVVACVGGHMGFMPLPDMRLSTFRRLAGRPTFPLELELHRLDCAGSHRDLGHYWLALDRLAELASQPVIPPLLVTGRDLLALGLTPGPTVGRLLKAIQEEQLEGRLPDRQTALDLAAQLVDKELAP